MINSSASFLITSILLCTWSVCAPGVGLAGQRSAPGSPPSVVAESPKVSEDWFQIVYDGKLVGYESLVTTPISGSSAIAGGRAGREQAPLVRRRRETRLKLRRFGTDLSVSAHLETTESPDGTLHSWSLRRTGAEGGVVERTGLWNAGKSAFEITEKNAAGWRQELLATIVQPRSAVFPGWLSASSEGAPRLRTVAVLFPETAAIVDMEIHRAEKQSLQMLNGKTAVAQRFDYWPTDRPDMKCSVWYNDQNAVERIEQPLMGSVLRMNRVDAAAALGQESMEALDLQFRSVLPLKRQISNLDRASVLRLKISVQASEQIVLPSSEFQSVEQLQGNELTVTVRKPELPSSTSLATKMAGDKQLVAEDYTSATRWLTSGDEDIRRMGIIAAGGTSIAVEKCRRLTRHVWKEMRFSSFSTSLLPASEIIRTMRGDCTEHAVLLSTLMRSQGIPARVAVGFVYMPNPASFAPHMWTEAFLDGKWIPFDSTRGPDGISLTHIKVSDSALSDDVGSGTLLFIPLLSFLGRAIVDVVPN